FDGSLLQINPALNGAPVLLSPAGTILSIAAGRGPDTVFAIATWGHYLWDYDTATGWHLDSTLAYAQVSATRNQGNADVLFPTLLNTPLGEFVSHTFTPIASGVDLGFTPR